VVVQLSSKITYLLWVADGREGLSGLFCNYPARSRTYCGSAMGEIESAGGSAAVWQDHVQAVGRRWEIESAGCCAAIQQDHVQAVGRRWEIRVSRLLCSRPARSHTCCGSPMGVRDSAGCSATIQPDHVHTVGPRWERWSQRVVLQLSSKITYRLWVSDGRDGDSGWAGGGIDRVSGQCGIFLVQSDHVPFVSLLL
jgi:hypothetical protein